MKHWIVLLLLGTFALTTDVKANIFTHGLRKAGQGAAWTGKKTGKLAGRGAAAAGKGLAKGGKKGVHGLARGTEKGAGKLAEKTN